MHGKARLSKKQDTFQVVSLGLVMMTAARPTLGGLVKNLSAPLCENWHLHIDTGKCIL